MKPTITEEVSEFNQEEPSPMWTHKPYKSILIVSLWFLSGHVYFGCECQSWIQTRTPDLCALMTNLGMH